eukprot:CAMPEP_0185723646 /NCGR_PEP_ID=MMETSP1171-20130828/416_1 /TAXON_ID=374046 /ORGANISM="Helicotheca tamensis, Strain CCMP826" /LENGTH=413 /DNA_ID=CAMNT_0028391381 /DNA_START=39 /DNA_END=1280 /DNA_ORIENTATION=+
MADEDEEIMGDTGEEDVVDEYTEVSEQGYCGRIGNSFKGILIGILLFFGSGAFLFWNEGRSAKRYASLKQGSKVSIAVKNDKVLSVNDGKLVVVSGYATTDETLRDAMFGVEKTNALQLRRDAEMYQWVEDKDTRTEKKAGGKTVTKTTYSYDKEWSSVAIDSGEFHRSSGHQNPGEILYESNKWTAADAKIGAFDLPSSEVERIYDWERFPVVPTTNTSKLPSHAQVWNGGFYIGKDPFYPQIGDIKLTYSVVLPTDITLVAQQRGNTFFPFTTKNGGTIDLLKTGILTKEEMFQAAKDENKLATWILRLVGIIVMYFGVSLVLDPLVVFSDVLPFWGDIVQIGVNIISGIVALVVSFVVIAIAWIFYRPIFAIGLLILSGGLIVLAFFLKKKKKEGKSVEENPTEESSLIV